MTRPRTLKNPVLDRMRDALGVTTDVDLAARLGLPKTTVSSWRRRGSVPYEKCVDAAAKSGTSIAWILTGEGERSAGSGPCLKPEILAIAIELTQRNYGEGIDDFAGVSPAVSAFYEFVYTICSAIPDTLSESGKVSLLRDMLGLRERVDLIAPPIDVDRALGSHFASEEEFLSELGPHVMLHRMIEDPDLLARVESIIGRGRPDHSSLGGRLDRLLRFLKGEDGTKD